MSRRLASFKLPPDLIVAARTKAAAEGVTVTSVVEAALREWVGDDGIESARRWRRNLHIWVSMANRGNAEASITLMIGGSIVSGIAISFSAWQRGLEELLLTGDTDTPEANATMAEGLRLARIDYEASKLDDLDPEVNHENEEPTWFTKIHLRDAVVHTNGQRMEVRYWRGELDRVDGWWLGYYE
jgi:hypothetical protein